MVHRGEVMVEATVILHTHHAPMVVGVVMVHLLTEEGDTTEVGEVTMDDTDLTIYDKLLPSVKGRLVYYLLFVQ